MTRSRGVTHFPVMQVQLPGWTGRGQVAWADGSADSNAFSGKTAAAAIASDGHALISWFNTSRYTQPVFAEWHAAQLGLRLLADRAAFAGRTGKVRLIGDNTDVARQLQNAQAGARVSRRAIGYPDAESVNEVSVLVQELAPLKVLVMHGKLTKAATAVTPQQRVVHALAYCTRRLWGAGLDPAAHAEWLITTAGRGSNRQQRLITYATRHIQESSAPAAER